MREPVTRQSGGAKASERTPDQGGKELDTRSRLLSAAGPVFAACGFDGATVREICAAANVNIASVGYHFGDKMGLYRQVIQDVRDAQAKRFPAPSRIESDPRRTLLKIVHTLLSRMLLVDESGWETQLLVREMQNPTSAFDNIVREFFRPLFNRLVDTLRLLLGPQADKHTLEQLALSTVGQCLYYRVGARVVQNLIPADEREQFYDIDSLSRHITAVMLTATDSAAVNRVRSEIEHWTL